MPDDMKRRWEQFLTRKKISQQDAITALINYTMDQSDFFQSILLGQMKADHDLLITVLRREGRKK